MEFLYDGSRPGVIMCDLLDVCTVRARQIVFFEHEFRAADIFCFCGEKLNIYSVSKKLQPAGTPPDDARCFSVGRYPANSHTVGVVERHERMARHCLGRNLDHYVPDQDILEHVSMRYPGCTGVSSCPSRATTPELWSHSFGTLGWSKTPMCE